MLHTPHQPSCWQFVYQGINCLSAQLHPCHLSFATLINCMCDNFGPQHKVIVASSCWPRAPHFRAVLCTNLSVQLYVIMAAAVVAWCWTAHSTGIQLPWTALATCYHVRRQGQAHQQQQQQQQRRLCVTWHPCCATGASLTSPC
jgi:hypothetical protein